MVTETFASAINNGNVEEVVQLALENINDACRNYPDSPRDAGVMNPERFIEHPLKLVKVEILDRDGGELTVDSWWGVVTVEFCADDNVFEFCGTELLEAMVS
jgi:hypothetical protein